MRVLILGAGISGHTAALLLKKQLPKQHEVVVISPNKKWNWIPSNIWVGVGDMTPEDVTFDLKPIYDKQKIIFHQAKAVEIYPEGNASNSKPFVIAEHTQGNNMGEKFKIEYDYLINATGPKLNFEATPGLGPKGHSLSVCTAEHAKETAVALKKHIEDMKNGAQKTFVVGTGHGHCTCEGAAFEYTFNLEFELRQKNVRDKAKIIYISNEAELGDFGVGGLHLKNGGFVTPSKVFAESLFVERGVDWIVGAHVYKVDTNTIDYEDLLGDKHQIQFDFAMLLPPFSGVPLKAFDKNNLEITSQLFNAGGFMKVDADYNQKPYEQWTAADWPKTYQTSYSNIFAIGIAFAPPHQISKPRKTKNGTMIAPAPPRTGMPSAIMGRVVAKSITDMINGVSNSPTQSASMADIGAACVASAGANAFSGSAVSMTMYPIVPNHDRYPNSGRSMTYTSGELGTAGHWIKKLLHYAFIYKAKALPFWWLIPE
ncbi:MAG: FAD-dependent oxidoreductase [Bdellovibrionaceae bacterium]|nr:FAD-dependent oxidoreductase [Pseudobdellovibrionaceae bacterium]